MLKKLINWLIAAVIIMAVPAGAAFALPEDQAQERVVKQEVIVGYFDVWKGSDWLDTNNDGDRDKPGQTGKLTKPFNYSAADKLNEWQITRVEVQPYPFSSEEYTAAGGRHYNFSGQPEDMSWDKFKWCLKYLPQNLTAKIADQNLPAGTASVQWGLDLPSNPIYNALDIKDLKNRQYIGYEPANIGSMVEGWRWYLPAIITWYGIPKTQINLVASSIDPGVPDEAEPGKTYTGTVKFKYFGTTPLENVPIGVFNGQYRATLKKNGQPVTSDNFAPDDVKTYTFTWTAPESGQTVLKGVIDTPPLPNAYQETTEEDNTIQITVFVSQPPPPSGPGSLTFQAVSQDRSKSRPAGTAKWTDWVTATLKPPAPTPPKGNLDSWEITSAKLTYPKKSPNFTFGTPYGPVGTKTITMNPNGHVAKVEFQEDWAMDGAKIYSLIEKRMMAEAPKNYTITASYTVEFKYQYRVRKTDSNGNTHYVTRYGTGSDSGTVTGQLLVNGTGVNSLAQ
ncbi:hypothetical protein [Desulfotruncus alcoholivorax]|uniref:hypothetical protein n=1 Tax=Desulfotruncus alcoholivorax TaxID=265477 RepID=UPI00041F6206|nr:hypothetical protein [Desulfotruncus alcoholivorax]